MMAQVFIGTDCTGVFFKLLCSCCKKVAVIHNWGIAKTTKSQHVAAICLKVQLSVTSLSITSLWICLGDVTLTAYITALINPMPSATHTLNNAHATYFLFSSLSTVVFTWNNAFSNRRLLPGNIQAVARLCGCVVAMTMWVAVLFSCPWMSFAPHVFIQKICAVPRGPYRIPMVQIHITLHSW